MIKSVELEVRKGNTKIKVCKGESIDESSDVLSEREFYKVNFLDNNINLSQSLAIMRAGLYNGIL